MTARFGKAQKAAALVPLAALSAAWTISLTGLGAGSAEATGTTPGPLPDGTVIPAKAIDAPATVTSPESGTDLSAGKAQQIVASADSSGIPAAALAAYQRAASVIDKADPSCHLDWQLLAAIGRVESNHGRSNGNSLGTDGIARPGIFGPVLNGSGGTTAIADTDGGQFDKDSSYDRAVGPMQFIPSTWSVVGVDADGDGQRNPQDINDASLAAAVYLCSGGGNLGTTAGQQAAVFRYNHSQSYVNTVLGVASAYKAGDYSSAPNYTVPASYFTPSPSYAAASSGKAKKSSKSSQTRQTESKTPSATPTTPAATPTTKPSSQPKTQQKPTSTPSVKAPAVPLPTKQVQATVASVAQLTQVCTTALTNQGASKSAPDFQKALQTCINQLTGKTLPEAEKAVSGIVSGLVADLGSALTGLLGGLLGGGK